MVAKRSKGLKGRACMATLLAVLLMLLLLVVSGGGALRRMSGTSDAVWDERGKTKMVARAPTKIAERRFETEAARKFDGTSRGDILTNAGGDGRLRREQTTSDHPPILAIRVRHGLGNRLRALASVLALAISASTTVSSSDSASDANGDSAQPPISILVIWERDIHCYAGLDELVDVDRLEDAMRPLVRGAGAGAAYGHPVLRVVDEFDAPAFETFEFFNYMDGDSPKIKDEFVMGNRILIESAYAVNHRTAGNFAEMSWMMQLICLHSLGDEVHIIVERHREAATGAALGVHIRHVTDESQDVPGIQDEGSGSVLGVEKMGGGQMKYYRNACGPVSFGYYMSRMADPSTVFYVASDSMEVYEAMWERFGRHRVLWLQERQDENCFDDPRSVACIQLALAELVLLSHTIRQIGSVYSSFSEIVGYMSGTIIPSGCDPPWMKFSPSGGFLRGADGNEQGFSYNDVSITTAFTPEETGSVMEALSSWMEAIAWYTEIILVCVAPAATIADASALEGRLRGHLRERVPDEIERQRVRLVLAAWNDGGGGAEPPPISAAYNLGFRLSTKRYVLKIGAHSLSRDFFSESFPFPFALYRGCWWEDGANDGVFMVEKWKLLEARGLDERIGNFHGLEYADLYQRLLAGADCTGDGCFQLWRGGKDGQLRSDMRLWQRQFSPGAVRYIGSNSTAYARHPEFSMDRGRLRVVEEASGGASRTIEAWHVASGDGASARWDCRGSWDVDVHRRRNDRGAVCVLRGRPELLDPRRDLGVDLGKEVAAGDHSLSRTEIGSMEELKSLLGGNDNEFMNQMLLVASIPRGQMRKNAMEDMAKSRAFTQNWYSRFLPSEVLEETDAA